MPRIHKTKKHRVQKIARKAVGKPFRDPSDRDAYRRRLKQWSDRGVDGLDPQPEFDADEIPRFFALLLALLVGICSILVILAIIFKR